MERKQYPITVEKLDDGLYLFNGNKRAIVKIVNGELSVRVGGGFVNM